MAGANPTGAVLVSASRGRISLGGEVVAEKENMQCGVNQRAAVDLMNRVQCYWVRI